MIKNYQVEYFGKVLTPDIHQNILMKCHSCNKIIAENYTKIQNQIRQKSYFIYHCSECLELINKKNEQLEQEDKKKQYTKRQIQKWLDNCFIIETKFIYE